MGTFQNRWRVHRPFGDIEIELHPDSSDDATIEDSVREIQHLVHDFRFRQPGALRVILEVHARMRGLTGSPPPSSIQDLDAGSSRAAAVGEELLQAARAGVIVARRREVRSVVLPLDTPSQDALGPASSEQHVYTIRVVDDTGAPVAGVALELDIDGGSESQTTSGSGDVTVTRSAPGTATFEVTNLADLRDKLWPQWAKPVADQAPAGDQVYMAPIGQPIAGLTAPSDWLVKLVLTRPPIWRVRMVGMLFDADKCFLIPQALDGIRSIVAMHQAHPAAKVLIVGHEGGDEVTAGPDIALARAKVLSAYLTSNPDDWMPWFDADKSQRQRWGVREVQLILSAMSGADGKPLYTGNSAGVMDASTTAALQAFQQASGLPVDGKAGAATRKALVTKYMSLEDTSLAAGVQPVAHGCSGHSDDTLTQDGLQPDDRRMEVLFFDVDMKPPPSGDTSSAGSPEYPAWTLRTVQTVDFENHGIHVQIVDTQKQPVALATVHLDGPAAQDTTADEHGFVSFWGLVAGDYTVQATSRTGIAVPPTKITYPTAKTVDGARALPTRARVAS
jgi:hypothetical protein